jgi:hypothetical protein
MNMNLASNIVELNNQAVGYLLQGNNDGSVCALGKALSDLQLYRDVETAAKAHFQQQQQQQQSFLEFPDVQMQESSNGASGVPLFNSSDCGGCACPTTTEMATTSLADKLFGEKAAPAVNNPIRSIPVANPAAEASESSGRFSVFSHALTISTNNTNNCEVSHNYQRFLAVILYNMGLSLHLQALKSGKSMELRGAQDLYEMSFSVVEQAWHEFDVHDLLLLLMALFNNLCHIHSTNYNVAQTETCVDWLKALAAHPTFQSLMGQDLYAPFFMNLLVVLKQQQCCSPAA